MNLDKVLIASIKKSSIYLYIISSIFKSEYYHQFWSQFLCFDILISLVLSLRAKFVSFNKILSIFFYIFFCLFQLTHYQNNMNNMYSILTYLLNQPSLFSLFFVFSIILLFSFFLYYVFIQITLFNITIACPNKYCSSYIQTILLYFLQFDFVTFMNQKVPVVIDNGSGTCKAGLSGQDAPRTEFPTAVGKPKMPSIMVGMDQKQAYVGHEAEAKKGVLYLKKPIQHGIITNWEDMIKIWHHTFYNELRITPEDHPCLLTEVPKNPKINREKITSIMFQTFNVPSLYLAIQAVLALYSSGRTTGLVLDSGAGVTHTVPIYQGYALPHAVERSQFAGDSINKYFHKLLEEAGIKFSLSAELQTVRDIKQQHGYVALDYNEEIKQYEIRNHNDCTYSLPDGQKITLGNQRFRATQIMYNPAPYGFQIPAFQEMVYQSIMKCDLDVRKDLYSNIVLSGGTTMFPQTAERLRKELDTLVPAGSKVNVVAPAERKFLTWIGGSILSSLGNFTAMWISKSDFSQNGPNIVHRKCF